MRRWVRGGGVAGVALLAAAVAGGAVCRFTPLRCRGVPEQNIFEGLAGSGTGRTTLPAGFRQEVVARGLRFPSACAFLPGGRILVAEKRGVVRVVADGRLRRRPLVDLSGRVSDFGYRGLLAIEPDPRFTRNGYLYVLYVVRRGPGETPTTGTREQDRHRLAAAARASARRRHPV